MTDQIAIRIPDALAAELESLVTSGRFRSKAAAVRAAIEQFVDAENRRRIGEEIAAAYRRTPQTDEDVEAAVAAAISSINEEPW